MFFFGKKKSAGEYIRIMTDSAPMACSLWDAEGNALDCNQEALTLFGLSQKQDYLERFHDLTPEYQSDGESSREKAARFIREALETGRRTFEWMYRTAEGGPLPVETSLARIPWGRGYRLVAYFRDLREIKAREAAAQEAELQRRLMLDSITLICSFWDLEGNLLDCNRRVLEVFGINDKQEFIDYFYRFSPDVQPDGKLSREKIEENIRDAVKNGKKVFYWEHRKSDGTPLPMEVTMAPIQWTDGRRVVAYARDISSLFAAEDNLNRMMSIVENSPNFVFYISADGAIEYINPIVSQVTGHSRDELLKEGLGRLFSPDDFRKLTSEYLAAVLSVGRMVNFEMGVFDKLGWRREYTFSAFLARLHNQKTGVGILGRDITELVRTQRDLEAARERAERALSNEVHYNRAKSGFLSRVSQELRTPVNVIIGMTDFAKRTAEKEELDQSLTKIGEAAEHLLGIINNILDMIGFDTGRFDFLPHPFSFSNAMQSVIDTITPKAEVKEQVFTVDIDSGIHDLVFSDERRLKQLLLNLLSNAVKFTPEKGSITLSAGMTEDDGKECTIRFEVSDNGIGVAPEARERIWDTFEQGDTGITRKYDGMGLGLPLAKRIAVLMKGDLRLVTSTDGSAAKGGSPLVTSTDWSVTKGGSPLVTSTDRSEAKGGSPLEKEPGKGSRFICDIRLARAEAEPAREGKNGEAGEAAVNIRRPSLLNGKRVLIAGNTEINRAALIGLLEKSGAVLDEAANGDDAVKLFSRNEYDLILLDLHMPATDGFTAAKQIRASARPRAKTIPIISVSSETSAEFHSKCLNAGITDHLIKPLAPEALLEMTAKWIPR